jgi:hypothetical protein
MTQRLARPRLAARAAGSTKTTTFRSEGADMGETKRKAVVAWPELSPEQLATIREMMQALATDWQITEALGIDPRHFRQAKERHRIRRSKELEFAVRQKRGAECIAANIKDMTPGDIKEASAKLRDRIFALLERMRDASNDAA